MASRPLGFARTWFQVHKWIGLLLALLIIPISLTRIGSGLARRARGDCSIPARFALRGRRRAGSLASSLCRGGARRWRPASGRLDPLPEREGRCWSPPRGRRPGAGAGRRTNVWLDPADRAGARQGRQQCGLVRIFHGLHGNLMVPGVGRQIVGWVGVAMFVSCLTGLWLWWPVTGSVRRGFRWKRHDQFDANLHHQMGFWILLPLAMLSFTGFWISFPQVFARLSAAGVAARPVGNPAARFRAQPLATPVQAIDAVVERVVAQIDGRPYVLTWPTDQRSEWTVSLQQEAGAAVDVSVNDATGQVRRQTPGGGGIGAGDARTARRQRLRGRLADGHALLPDCCRPRSR